MKTFRFGKKKNNKNTTNIAFCNIAIDFSTSSSTVSFQVFNLYFNICVITDLTARAPALKCPEFMDYGIQDCTFGGKLT